MNTQAVNNDIVFINPYDIKGGASMGTFRLFSYFQEFISSSVRLLVVVKSSSDPLVYGLSFLFRFLFYSQAAFNKLLCRLISKKNLPVAFTFFVPFSLPAIALFLKGRNAASVYLHSMSSGFACPLSFYLLLRKASVVKTADDWYLTGGCHYSFDCNQWKSGCSSCPYMNSCGLLSIDFILRKVLGIFSVVHLFRLSLALISLQNLYSDRCLVVYNSASSPVVNLLSPQSITSQPEDIGNFVLQNLYL